MAFDAKAVGTCLSSSALVGAAFAICGCGSLSGFTGPEVDPSGDVPDASIAEDEDAARTRDAMGAGVPKTCATEQPDEAHAIFVSTSGTTAPNCGSKTLPCGTLALGVQRAKIVLGTEIIYVDSGKYVESVQLIGGIRIQGGWDDVGGAWHRQCTGTRAASVKIRGAGGKGVVAKDLTMPAVLDTLTIELADGGSGQSLYGVFASGTSTSLTLVDVSVVVGNAGAGASGSTGADGQNTAANCTGTSGADGAMGAKGANGASGTFGPNGYTPGASGATGGSGGAGTGTAGGAASSNGPTQCVASCATTCGGPGTCSCNVSYTSAGTIGSQPGTGGCGGEGGREGAGGEGGASAVGVFAWDARVTIAGGSVRSGDGGSGGNGGAGGSGASGSPGTKGSDASCVGECRQVGFSCQSNALTTIPGGAAGATGGSGGKGGTGGGGAGGASYAIFRGPTAVVATNGAALGHGPGGAGAAGAPTGNAGDIGP